MDTDWHAMVGIHLGVGAGLLPDPPFDFHKSAPTAQTRDEQLVEFLKTLILHTPQGDPAAEPLLLSAPTSKQSYVFERIRQTLQDRPSTSIPLRMLLYGGPGTGKTRLIQTLSHLFDHDKRILKLSLSKHAASRIDGITIEACLRLTQRQLDLSSPSGQRLQARLVDKQLLIIDDISTLSKATLSLISDRITAARVALGICSPSDTFGGMDVVLSGDFHQMPPPGVRTTNRLYVAACPQESEHLPQYHELVTRGREIYASFQDIVSLEETGHDEWKQILDHIRNGRSLDETYTHIHQIASIHGNDFHSADWIGAPLISWHTRTREAWNRQALMSLSQRQSKQVYTWRSNVTVNDAPAGPDVLANLERFKSRSRISIAHSISLCVGAQVTVSPEATKHSDITTGILGTVLTIVLDAEETALPNEDQEVFLTQLPYYILVQVDPRHNIDIPGLPSNVLMVTPNTFEYNFQDPVTEVQYPLTLAFAISPLRVRGQTVKKAILDLAGTFTGTSMPTQWMYDALSRFADTTSFRLLRPLDYKIFTSVPSNELVAEEARLAELSIRL
jgi:hypothetical protein